MRLAAFSFALLLFLLTLDWRLHFSCHLPHLFSSQPSPSCPEGVNCRVGRVLVRAPGWQGPPTLSFTQDRLIRGSVKACLSRQLMDNQATRGCIRAWVGCCCELPLMEIMMMERFGSDKISRCIGENSLHRFCVFDEKASVGSHKCVDLYQSLNMTPGKTG